MRQDNHLPDDYAARIINKSASRLRHWMHKEMHRPWPNTDKIWRIQQRCRRYEEQLNEISSHSNTGSRTQH